MVKVYVDRGKWLSLEEASKPSDKPVWLELTRVDDGTHRCLHEKEWVEDDGIINLDNCPLWEAEEGVTLGQKVIELLKGDFEEQGVNIDNAYIDGTTIEVPLNIKLTELLDQCKTRPIYIKFTTCY